MLQDQAAPHEILAGQGLEAWYGTIDPLRTMQESHALYSRPASPDFFNWAVQWLELKAGETVLDVGCGFGAFHPALERAGAQIIGLDQSPILVNAAHEAALARGTPIFGLSAWAQNLPLRDGCVDAAMSNYALHHLSQRDLPTSLREIKRVIKTEGKVVVCTHSKNHLARLRKLHAQAAGKFGLVAYPPGWFSLDDIEYMRAAFADVRLEVVDSSFAFPSTEAVIKYYASQMVDFVFNRPEDGRHRPALLQYVATRVDDIVRAEGEFVDAKMQGCFVATVSK